MRRIAIQIAVWLINFAIAFAFGFYNADKAWRVSADKAGLLFRDHKTNRDEWSLKIEYEAIDDKTAAIRFNVSSPLPAMTAAKFFPADPLLAHALLSNQPTSVHAWTENGEPADIEWERRGR